MPTELTPLLLVSLERLIARIEAGDPVLSVPVSEPWQPWPRLGSHLHAHPELFLQCAGISRLSFPAETVRLEAGCLLLVPRGVSHTEQAVPPVAAFHNLVISFDHAVFNYHDARANARRLPRVNRVARCHLDDLASVEAMLDRIALIARQPGPDPMLRRERDALLVAALARFHHALQAPGRAPEDHSPKVMLCLRLIQEHLGEEDLTVRGLAASIGCAPDYLSNRFHREVGQTISRYLNEKRVAVARSLLVRTALNVSEVAAAVGYRSPGYFAREFRRRTGRAPREFRRLAG